MYYSPKTGKVAAPAEATNEPRPDRTGNSVCVCVCFTGGGVASCPLPPPAPRLGGDGGSDVGKSRVQAADSSQPWNEVPNIYCIGDLVENRTHGAGGPKQPWGSAEDAWSGVVGLYQLLSLAGLLYLASGFQPFG